jgi:histidinol-phosphatase (PHP family)
MIADYHNHTNWSPDGKGTMEEYIAKAQERGISEIGFSDHMLVQKFRCYPRMTPESMPEYVRSFLDVRERSKLPVKLGIEMDFIPGDAEAVRDFISKYPFDYVIGSVHLIGDWEFEDQDRVQEYLKRDIMQVYEDYFSLVKQLCKTGFFNILAHPDLIKIRGFKPNRDFSALLTDVAETMAEADVCAEINMRGLTRPCKEIYPSEHFLRILHANDVQITFGSDAHEPEELGRYLDEGIHLAKKVGYTSAIVFDHRRKRLESMG